MSYFSTAQVCLNGHVITWSIEQEPYYMENFCSDCSAKTITKCPTCGEPIRGNCYNDSTGFENFNIFRTPDSYCHNCSSAFPWTVTALETAEAIMREDELLTDDQIQQFCKYLPDLIVETSKTKLALIRFKKLIDNAASGTGPAIIDVLKNVAPEVLITKLINLI